MADAPSMINIRNLSVKCGRCGRYQVLAAFEGGQEDEHGELWNVYTYECDWPPCDDDPGVTRTLVEVPADLDEFARRDPGWRGGRIHGGAEARAEGEG